jgi:hypothetical protein
MANGHPYKFSPIYIFVLLSVLVTSCSQVNEVSLESTARVMAQTMNYKTIQALPATATQQVFPTNTWVPTLTSVKTSTQTDTSISETTAAGESTPAGELTPTSSESNVAQTFEPTITPSDFFPTYTPLPFMAAWKLSSIRFVNNSGKTVKFTLYGAEVIDLTIGKTLIIKVRFDTYYFTAYIGKSGPYNGSIFINNIDRYTIFIDEDNIRVANP